MTAAAARIIDEFKKLPAPDQKEALSQMMQAAAFLDYGDLSDEDLTAIAAQTFAMLDREEDEAAAR